MAGDSRDSSWLRLPTVEFFLWIFSFGEKPREKKNGVCGGIIGILFYPSNYTNVPQILHVLPKLCSQYKYQREMNEKCWFSDDSG